MLQCFDWYMPNGPAVDRPHGQRAGAGDGAGFTAIWLPPAYKGSGGADDVGYGVYDLFDLGEFDQKGTVATKYGTDAELLAALAAAPGGRPAGLRRRRVQPQERRRRDRGRLGPAGRLGRPQPPGQRLAPDQGLDALRLPRPRRQVLDDEWHWWRFDAVSYDHNHPIEAAPTSSGSRTSSSPPRSATSTATTTT